MFSLDQAKRIIEDIKGLVTDEDRLNYLKAERDVRVDLDNDASTITIDVHWNDENYDEVQSLIENAGVDFYRGASFDEFHGWRDGVIKLFKFAGIKAESV